ncbi:MAG: tetratricopeptide repeat protein [Planctomycetes bacterium]|nr:tetratricopeptide repeat protein [Planctomycetota bacterium]
MVVALLLVGIAVVVTHWPALGARALTFDDDEYLLDNEVVQQPSWGNASRFLAEVLRPSTVQGYYQPLTMISLMLDCVRGGTPSNLRPFHETSLALHVMNTWLVIGILYLLFGRLTVAAVVGLVFGVHPMTVEPVAWVGERKTILAGFFALWSVLSYVRYVRTNRWGWYGVATTGFVLALLSKPTAVPLALVMVALDAWPLRRSNSRHSLWEKVPFLALAGIFALVTIVSQRHMERVALSSFSAGQTLLLMFHNPLFYIGHMTWPSRLSPLYPFPEVISFANVALLVAVIANVLLFVALLISLRWTRALLIGWLCYLILLFPTLLNKGYSPSVAWDKYAYLPAIGLLMILAWAVGLGYDLVWAARGPKVASGVVIGAAVVLAGLEFAGTRAYLRQWRDTLTLHQYMASLAPRSVPVRYNLGLAYAEKGDVPAAMTEFKQAIALNANHVGAHGSLANLLLRLNRPTEAATHLVRALELDPSLVMARNSLANVLAMQGRHEEAFAQYQEVLRINPDYVNGHRNYGLMLRMVGKNELAAVHLARVIELGAGDASVHNQLGLALAALGRREEAGIHFRKAARLAPDWPEPRLNETRLRAAATATAPVEHSTRAGLSSSEEGGQDARPPRTATYPGR